LVFFHRQLEGHPAPGRWSECPLRMKGVVMGATTGGRFDLMGSILQWLVAYPSVRSALDSAAASGTVKSLSSTFLGTQDVPPDTLLLTLIILWLSAYFFLYCYVEKFRLLMWGWWYFVASQDKKTNKPTAESTIPVDAIRKKIVFIRHGESEWNAVFNKGSKLLLPVRFFRALIKEFMMIFEEDSLFFDSPLSKVGLQQAWELCIFFASSPRSTLDISELETKTVDIKYIRDNLARRCPPSVCSQFASFFQRVE